MEVLNIRRDLVQCWVASTLVQVLARVSQDSNYLLLSVGDTVVQEEGTLLLILVKGMLHENNQPDSGDYAHVHSLDELQQWTATRAARAEPRDGVLVVVYTPYKVNQQVHETMEQLGTIWRKSLLLGVGFEARDCVPDKLWYHLRPLTPTEQWNPRLTLIAQPLQYLRDQCSWYFMLEIVHLLAQVAGTKMDTIEPFGAARRRLFASMEHIPFQLLVLVLRWSHFHPQLVDMCSVKFHRQVHWIPQSRVRHELVALEQRGRQLWKHIYPLMEGSTTPSTTHDEPSSVFRLLPFCTNLSPTLARVSHCQVWTTQKQFYKAQGLHAWSSGAIPFGLSSTSFLAAAYARTAMDFLLSHAASVTVSTSSTPNCFVWEAASGSCKFLHAFLVHFTALMDAHDEFQTQRLVPLIVATDLSAHVLGSRAQLACFEPFRARGLLDFALFDTHDFVHGSAAKRKTLDLLLAQRTWHVGTDGPVVLIGNYFFDSLPVDVFPVVREDEDRVVVYEALVEQETLRLADLDLVLSPVREASTQSMYQDARVNATLRQVLDDFQSTDEMSGLILFPVDAIALFLTLFDPPDASTAFPIAVLAGDAKHSFRDAISSAFVDWKNAPPRLHLPQLSPHPDCFCLPVDFAIFQLFFDLVDRTSLIYSGRSHLVAAPANDTFDVFYAILEPQSPPSTTSNTTLVASFAHQFAWLTASDYDLVWGMMSCDDAALCFSIDALLGLLAQSTWDFDLFAVVMWELLRRWRCQATNATSAFYRNLLIEAGSKSWRTFFPMENTVHLLHRLQVARWFYALEAYENVLALFTCWQDHTPPAITSNEVAVFYLLGLTSLRNKQPWQALSFFRLCARGAPTKVKYQRQIARTLSALQAMRSAASSSSHVGGTLKLPEL